MKISKKLKRIASLLSVGVLILALTGCTAESNADNEIIKVGVVGENNEAWEQVIKNVSKDGIDVELVKFSDYSQVNQALVDGEIDLNSFQHYAYLEKEKEDKGFELSVIGETLIAPLGVYSNTLSDIKDIKVGGKIAIPNDATNEGRALKLLESAGLIKVNQALVDGEIDLNSFQHYAYLEKEKEDKGFELSVIGETLIAPLGVYSNTLSDIKDIKVGGKIAIPNALPF